MHRVVRHTGEIKKEMTTPVARTGADGTVVEQGEHKIMGIETRVLVAAGLLGVLTWGMFAYDPVPRKPRPKKGLSFGGAKTADKGYTRRNLSESELDEAMEAEVERDEAEIDEEFETTDMGDEDEDESEEEDE